MANLDFVMQINEAFNNPLIIIQGWPADQQIAGALTGADSVNETLQYMQALPSLGTAVCRSPMPNSKLDPMPPPFPPENRSEWILWY